MINLLQSFGDSLEKNTVLLEAFHFGYEKSHCKMHGIDRQIRVDNQLDTEDSSLFPRKRNRSDLVFRGFLGFLVVVCFQNPGSSLPTMEQQLV